MGWKKTNNCGGPEHINRCQHKISGGPGNYRDGLLLSDRLFVTCRRDRGDPHGILAESCLAAAVLACPDIYPLPYRAWIRNGDGLQFYECLFDGRWTIGVLLILVTVDEAICSLLFYAPLQYCVQPAAKLELSLQLCVLYTTLQPGHSTGVHFLVQPSGVLVRMLAGTIGNTKSSLTIESRSARRFLLRHRLSSAKRRK